MLTHDEKIAMKIKQILEMQRGTNEPTSELAKLYREYFEMTHEIVEDYILWD